MCKLNKTDNSQRLTLLIPLQHRTEYKCSSWLLLLILKKKKGRGRKKMRNNFVVCSQNQGILLGFGAWFLAHTGVLHSHQSWLQILSSVLAVEMGRTHAGRSLMGPARWAACAGLAWLGCIQDKASNFGLPLKIKLALNYTFDLLFSFRVEFSRVSTWSLIYSWFDISYSLELWEKSFLPFQPPGFLQRTNFFTVSNIVLCESVFKR